MKRELMLKAAFLRATDLRVNKFVPATGIGKFDLAYDPKQNRIDITVNAAYRFARDLQKPEQLAWDTEAELKFKQGTKPLIESGWSGLYTITCARPGWHDLFADVHVTFNEVALNKAAYIVEVVRLAQFKSSGGINHGVTPHVCDVNNFANDTDTSKNQEHLFNYKEGLIRNHLRDTGTGGTGDFLPFRANSTDLGVPERLALAKWIARVRSIRTSELVGVKAFVVGLRGKADSMFTRNLQSGRATEVVGFINSALGGDNQNLFAEAIAENSPLVSSAVKQLKTRANIPASTGNTILGPGGVLIVIGTRTQQERTLPFKYVVMKHEFGHMLGLPDEYMGVHDTYTQSLAKLDAVIPQTYQAATISKEGDHKRLEGMQHGMAKSVETSGVPLPHFMGTKGDGDRLTTNMHTQAQDLVYDKLKEAREKYGKDSPTYQRFKRNNPLPEAPTSLQTISDSIMHSGSQILPCHYVTIWSALCKATAGYLSPNEWKIVPNPNKPSTVNYFKG